MSKRMPVVFVSSTNADLLKYRQAALEQFLKGRVFPDTQESLEPSDPTIIESIRRSIRQADAVVCMIGTHFGTAPLSRPDRSYTQIEYDIACELGKRVFVLITKEDWEPNPNVAQSGEEQESQQRHRAAITASDKRYQRFGSEKELRLRVAELGNAIHDLAGTKPPPTDAIDLLPGLRDLPELDTTAPLDTTLKRLLSVALAPLVSWLTRPAKLVSAESAVVVKGISRSFWESGAFAADDLVTIEGSLSNFAPLFAGPPYAKRDYHQRYRQQLDPDDIERHSSIVDAKLGFSAGQMVWRLNLDWLDYVYVGLYRSIVRNAIPVYVRCSTFAEQAMPEMSKHGTQVIEARVTGRLVSILPYQSSLRAIGVNTRDLATLQLGNGFALFIDSEEFPETGIQALGPPRYLDGDIWVAIREDCDDMPRDLIENMPGVNISDKVDYDIHRMELQRKLDEQHKGCEVIYQYDQVDRLNALQSDALHSLQIVKSLAQLNDNLSD